MSSGSESTSASVHSPADPRVARVPQISAHMSMNVGIRFGAAAPSPFCLIVRKVAYHCQTLNILPPAFPQCAAWAVTINGIVATHIGAIVSSTSEDVFRGRKLV